MIGVEGLFDLRVEVTECDRQIAELLARRSRAVAKIQTLKASANEAVRDPGREAAIIEGAYSRMRACEGRYDRDTIRRVWNAVFDGCERLEAAVPRSVDGGDRGGSGY